MCNKFGYVYIIWSSDLTTVEWKTSGRCLNGFAFISRIIHVAAGGGGPSGRLTDLGGKALNQSPRAVLEPAAGGGDDIRIMYER